MAKSQTRQIPEIEQIFDTVSKYYDVGNLLISGGTIGYTRKQAALALPNLGATDWILDAACGQGDLSKTLSEIHGIQSRFQVVGVDISLNMLKKAVIKTQKIKYKANQFYLVRGNAFRLPFPDRTFQAVVIGYGLRNLTPRKQGLAEFYRVTKGGGTLICLETSHASSLIAHTLQTIQFRYLIPIIGRFLRRKDEDHHLCQSIAQFPTALKLKKEFEAVGWTKIHIWPILGGSVVIHVAVRPNK